MGVENWSTKDLYSSILNSFSKDPAKRQMGSKKLCAESNCRAFTSLRALTTFCIVSTVYVLYVCVHLCVKKLTVA